MFGRNHKTVSNEDGEVDQPDVDDDLDELTDRDLGLEDEDPADRRRDPLRKP